MGFDSPIEQSAAHVKNRRPLLNSAQRETQT